LASRCGEEITTPRAAPDQSGGESLLQRFVAASFVVSAAGPPSRAEQQHGASASASQIPRPIGAQHHPEGRLTLPFASRIEVQLTVKTFVCCRRLCEMPMPAGPLKSLSSPSLLPLDFFPLKIKNPRGKKRAFFFCAWGPCHQKGQHLASSREFPGRGALAANSRDCGMSWPDLVCRGGLFRRGRQRLVAAIAAEQNWGDRARPSPVSPGPAHPICWRRARPRLPGRACAIRRSPRRNSMTGLRCQTPAERLLRLQA